MMDVKTYVSHSYGWTCVARVHVHIIVHLEMTRLGDGEVAKKDEMRLSSRK
jgi:hypothetical protein